MATPTLSLDWFTIRMVAKKPTLEPNWKVQYYNNSVAITNASLTLTRRVNLQPGTYSIQARWTKPGRDPILTGVHVTLESFSGRLNCDKPTTEANWKVQYFNVSTALAPASKFVSQRIVFVPGDYSITAVWTKTGSTVRSNALDFVSDEPDYDSDTDSVNFVLHDPAGDITPEPDPGDPPAPPDPTDPVVNCQVSPWGEWSAWGPISSTVEARSRTRHVTTQPSGGGTACPNLTEIQTRPITTPPPPPAGNVLSPANITYLGAIRMPTFSVDTTFAYGGLAGRKVGSSLRIFLMGNVVSSRPEPGDMYELDITGLVPNPDPALAPRAVLHRNWGNIYHGKRQSWEATPPYAQQDLTGLNAFNQGIYWNEASQQLFWAYAIGYTATAPWSVAFSTLDEATGSSTAYGPFRFTATDDTGPQLGTRAQWFAEHPTTGQMLMGGIAKSGAASLSFGPSMFGNVRWPIPGDPSGQSMTAITQGDKYLTYYSSLFAPTGEPNVPLKSFVYPSELKYIFEYAPAQSTDRVDPALNGGRGTWSDVDGVLGALWFEGVNRRGVLFFGTLMAGHSASSSDPNACHQWYSNEGQIGMNVSGVVGAFQNGETITGGTSGATGSLTSFYAPTPAIHVAQGSPYTPNYTVGETVTGGTSGAHAVVASFRRNAPNCAHGFPPATLGITGPVTTKSIPVIIIYDPDKLEAVEQGSATDYAQEADYVIDVEQEYGVVTAAQGVVGGAKNIAGGYFDVDTNRLYLAAVKADITRAGSSFQETLIHVFHIADIA